MYIQFWSLEKFLYKNKPFRRFFRFFFLFPRLGSVKNRKPAVKEIYYIFFGLLKRDRIEESLHVGLQLIPQSLLIAVGEQKAVFAAH